MKRILKKLVLCLFLAASAFAISGCRILDEDPNEAQLPWATPANWEGTVPGMPNPGGGF